MYAEDIWFQGVREAAEEARWINPPNRRIAGDE